MERVRLYVLGAVHIERGGAVVVGFESRKAQALLCYLAFQSQPKTRAHLAEMFWPDRLEERSRGNLNRVLHNLTHILPGCLDVNRQTVGIAFGTILWTDIAEFDQLIKQGDLESLSAAVALFRGDVLADFTLDDCPEFDQWLEERREEWRQSAIKILYRLIEHHYHAGTYTEGIAHAEHLLTFDPWQEEAYRATMWMLAASGLRSAALAQYEKCRRILADELSMEPERATVTLYDQIREGREIAVRTVGESLVLLPRAPTSPALYLPRPATSFIGRERELTQIVDYLTTPECHLLTLLGLGGIGKTRLALRAAEILRPHFPDGVAFVSLEPGSPETFLFTVIADACNFVFARGTDPGQQLINYLRRRQLLLLLDNGEYLGPMAHTLATLLAQIPNIVILATSRERLRIQGEWVFDVDGLEVAESTGVEGLASAIQLFNQRVELVRSGRPLTFEEIADAARICQLVAGSPLAIELAAGWARVLTCREIAHEVAHDLDFLTASLKDIPERHHSLRVVFEHSWQLLTEAERVVCRKLSVFRGGFDRMAAEHVAGAIPTILAALADKLFIHRGTVKQYVLHELVRQYTQAKLEEDPDEYELAQRRHVEYYALLLQDRAPVLEKVGRTEVHQQALAEINAEIENIRAGWNWTMGHQPIETIEPFVERLALFYNHQGWFAEVVSLLQDALHIHMRQQDPTADQRAGRLRHARWERQIGVALYGLGRIAESQTHLHRALEVLGQPVPMVHRRLVVGLVGQALQQAWHRLWPNATFGRAPRDVRDAYIEAARVFERLTEVYYFNDQTIQTGYTALKALNLSESYGVSQELVRTYAQASIAASIIPFISLADAYGRRAQQIAQQIVHPPAHAFSLLCAGAVDAGLGRWETARAALEESMATAATCGDQRVWEESLTNLIMVTYYQGELTRHLRLCEQLQTSADRRGDAQVQSWARMERGMNCLVIGPVDAAPALFEQALALVSTNMGHAEEIMARGLLAQAYLDNDDQQHALAAAARAAQLTARAWPTTYFSIHGYIGVAAVYLTLWERGNASSAANLGHSMRAAQYACRALWRCAHVFPVARPYAALWDGLRFYLLGRAASAHTIWKVGLSEAERLGMLYLQGLLHERLARSHGSDDQARRKHAEQAYTLFEQIQAPYDLARAKRMLGSR